MTVRKAAARPVPRQARPRAYTIAQRGFGTTSDVTRFLSVLLQDLVSGRVENGVASVAISAAGVVQDAADLQARRGTPASNVARHMGTVAAALLAGRMTPTEARRAVRDARRLLRDAR
jgi:hypothetical protein